MSLQPRRSRVWPIVSLAVVALAALAGVFVALNSLSNQPGATNSVATPNTAVTSQVLAAPSTSTPTAAATQQSLPTATTAPPTATTGAVVATDTSVAPTEIPTAEAPTPAPPTPTSEAQVITYTVVAGDSCYAIFQRFDISVEDIIRINKLSANCFIQPGDVLIVSK